MLYTNHSRFEQLDKLQNSYIPDYRRLTKNGPLTALDRPLNCEMLNT